MSAVGICRVFTAIFVMVFMISIIAYAEYELSSLAPCNDTLQYTRYILPTLILICYILLISTYTLCILIKPGRIPDEYNLTTVEIAKFMIQPNTAGHYQAITELTRQYITTRPDLQVRERDYRHGGLRICEICSIIKPDRSHHCSICQRCVIRMDHHCHWVNNCIHAGNHKYFIQTITVGVILGVLILIYCALDITCACTAIPSSGTALYPVCVVVYLGTSIAAFVSFFLIFLTLDHCNNLFRGQTSYERVYHRDHYNRGWKQNFCTIMGSNICQWILPITPTKLTGEREPLIVTVEGASSEVWFATTENLQTSGRGPHHSNVSIEETLSLRHEVVSPRAGGIPPNIIVNPPSSNDGSESNKNRKPSTMSK